MPLARGSFWAAPADRKILAAASGVNTRSGQPLASSSTKTQILPAAPAVAFTPMISGKIDGKYCHCFWRPASPLLCQAFPLERQFAPMLPLPTQLSPPIVLTFAASDPCGGAGIQADLMTIAALGCHPLSVITALTVQDTIGIDGVLAIDSCWVEDQARALLEDMPVDAFKIGLLGSIENIAVIARILSDYPDIPLVFDPVLASGRGDELADEEMIAALQDLLLPQTTVLTPNSLEARRLARWTDADENDEELEYNQPLAQCARRLLTFGCDYVLLTGTHESTPQVVNELHHIDGLVRSDVWQRLPGSYHGSGCTLASAVAAGLAHRLSVSAAVGEAQDYTWKALAAGFRPGMGQFIPDRFFWARHKEENNND
jgi:hydroxymethylpyrimidine/phosphomethylpyrimidine kinase